MAENLLARETSPYLLQHKDNPVAWRAWGPDALAEARADGRPILLSIGYAACHWCHVMAHESFEDPETAARMNALFVNVKVDREERPDLDAIYQHALALMGEQGGWPLTMFLTPDGEPFWGGTYFPPAPRYGRPGFPQVLESVSRVFRDEPERLRENVETIRSGLSRLSRAPGDADLGRSELDAAARALLAMTDTILGGLRGAPKFPQVPIFEALWRAWLRTGEASFAHAVTVTCERMCQGGIYDHLGGGFARYSTDPLWLVPHFEKMLYDNAQILDLLTLVWQGTKTPLFETRIRETVDWLLREMVVESGAFAATLDADSEGEEGRFYVWDESEVEAALGADARLFKVAYDVSAGGNWEGRNVLNRLRAPSLEADDEARLAGLRRRMRARREKRPRPARDDKVLADWNGLAVHALARAGAAFGEPAWTAAARRAFDAVTRAMGDGDRLFHAWRRGEARHAGMLEDYANMARAALALYETDRAPHLLEFARRWVAVLEERFRDSAGGGYFQSADDAGDVIVRATSAADGAVPPGNAVMLGVLSTLAAVSGEDARRRRADELIAAFGAQVARHPASACAFMNALEQAREAPQIVVVGDAGDPDAEAFVRFVNATCLPGRTLSVIADGDSLPAGHPAAGKRRVDGKTAVYVCRGQTCSPPATDTQALAGLLQRRAP